VEEHAHRDTTHRSPKTKRKLCGRFLATTAGGYWRVFPLSTPHS